MSETTQLAPPPEASAVSPAPAPYSKDYWDTVFEQIARRRLVKLSLACLALLYATAVYAPLIANDRPFLIRGVDFKEYEAARRSLYPVTLSLKSLVEEREEGYQERLAKKAEETRIRRQGKAPVVRVAKPPTYEEALDQEVSAAEIRAATMRRSLPRADRAPLQELLASVRQTGRAAKAGDVEAAAAAAAESVRLAGLVRSDLVARDPGRPDQSGKELVASTSFPIFEATTGLEVFFMVLWAQILTWPLWNRWVNRRRLAGDRLRIRLARRRKLGVVLALSLASALLWSLFVGGQMTFETARYKADVTSLGFVPERIVWAPVRLGFAETHMDEQFRPPTWKASSEITESGHYARGPRAPKPDRSGHQPPGKPIEVRAGEPPINAATRHLLGTDSVGRDLLVRILYGGRISLVVGLLSTTLLVIIGVIAGACAGYFGGRIDIAISRIIEIVQSFPSFFLILTAVSLIPEQRIHPLFAIVFFIAIVGWTSVARLVRAEFLRLKEQDFVVASRALGFTPARVIFRHVLPNAMGPVLVAAAFSIAAGILIESAISFLGLGIKHPIPSWGSLLNESRVAEYWWIQIFPGLLIFVTVFCYNLVGEGLRDALDPRMKV